MPAITVPTSRLSPSSASPRISGEMPACCATAAAACNASAGLPISRRSGFGACGLPASAVLLRAAATAGGGVMPKRAIRSAASSRSPDPPVAGRAAATAGSSPVASVTTRAGRAACASLPPLVVERRARTRSMSSAVAPAARNARLTTCLSASVISVGRASSVEPPPEMSTSTRSFGSSPCTSASMRLAARVASASVAACVTSMRRVEPASPPRVATRPDRRTSGQACSTAAAIAAADLPAPTTTQRPLGRCGRCRASTRPGSADSTAASNEARSSSRARSSFHSRRSLKFTSGASCRELHGPKLHAGSSRYSEVERSVRSSSSSEVATS